MDPWWTVQLLPLTGDIGQILKTTGDKTATSLHKDSIRRFSVCAATSISACVCIDVLGPVHTYLYLFVVYIYIYLYLYIYIYTHNFVNYTNAQSVNHGTAGQKGPMNAPLSFSR